MEGWSVEIERLDEEAGFAAPMKKTRIAAPELYRNSKALVEAGELDEGVLMALESLEAKRASPAHFEHAARVLNARGLHRIAILVAEQALRLGLDKPAIHVQLARALNRKGDQQGALEHFDAAVALAPENEGFRRFRDKIASRVDAETAVAIADAEI